MTCKICFWYQLKENVHPIVGLTKSRFCCNPKGYKNVARGEGGICLDFEYAHLVRCVLSE